MIGLDRLGLRFGGGGAPAFVPSSLTGCNIWLRADMGITMGTGVAAWADQSGSGDSNRNALQATGALQPTITASDAAYGNKPTLQFGSTSILITGTWSAALVQPVTVMVIGHALAGSKYFVDSLFAGAQCAVYSTAGSVALFAGANGATALSATSPMVCIATFSGSSSKANVSAHTPSGALTAGTNGATGVTIGNYAGNGFGGSTIAEVAYWNRALTSGEIDQLNAYASARYGITIGA